MSTAVDNVEHLGPYTLVRHLGSGGMGEVHLAFDERLRRNVAIKKIPPAMAADPSVMNRLRREARLASSLSHPNVITIYDIVEEGSAVYVAMEYVDGKSLRDLLDDGPLPVRKALELAVQIADGLSAAHRREIVHRDLKPENVMLTTDGVVKILDFGLARSVAPPFGESGTIARDSLDGRIAGTCGYMSPEQARGQQLDYRSDQFSFGVMLYELLSGRKPFEGESAVETLFMIVRDEPAPLSSAAPQVPPPLRWAIDRCLAKSPDDRYASTHDLARDLRDLRDHFSEAGAPAVAAAPPQPKASRRKNFIGGAAVLLIVGALAGAIGARLFDRPGPPPLTSFAHLTYSGLDYSPAVSPDRKTIAFSSFRDGQQRIWLKQLSGGAEAALTEGPADDFPRFSPDGNSLLYRGAAEGRTALYRTAVVGGERRTIVTDATSGDWSPDGRSIAFTRVAAAPRPMGSLYVARADGSDARLIASFPQMPVNHPRWSPDGTKIALVGSTGRSVQNVVIVDAGSGRAIHLTGPKNSGEVSSAVWARDGRSIVYSRGNSVEVVVGSTATIIRHDIDSDEATPIAWSPSNGTILDRFGPAGMVFDSRSATDNLRELVLGRGLTQDGHWLTRGNSSDRQPVYSPDGTSIVFSSNRSGNLDLWQIEPASGVVSRITDDTAEDWDPAFTADGRIIWSSGRTGNLEIWMAERDGSNARQVSRDGVDAENPTVTRDGRWIVYNSFNPQKLGVWRINADGSGAVQIVRGRTALPEMSPDGQYVAYIANSRSPAATLRVARVSDGRDTGFEVKLTARRRTSAILGRARWMPDSRTIAFLAQDDDGVNGVFAQDFRPGVDTTATRRKLGGFDPHHATESFGISPDGSRITVAGWEQLFGMMTVSGLPLSEES